MSRPNATVPRSESGFAEYCAVLRAEPQRFRRYVASPVLVVNLPIRLPTLPPVDRSATTLDQTLSGLSLNVQHHVEVSRLVCPVRAKDHDAERRSFTIGRGSSCDVSLAYEGVSRVHATIEQLADGTFTIRDASSKNGTYLDGERIPPDVAVALSDDSHLIFGEVEADFFPAEAFRMELHAKANRRQRRE